MSGWSEDELEPLITECPACQTRFRVSEPQLEHASGKVRCGACLTVFNGIQHLVVESAGEYGDPGHAQAALDALLDELADHNPRAPGRTRSADDDAAQGEAVPQTLPVDEVAVAADPPLERDDGSANAGADAAFPVAPEIPPAVAGAAAQDAAGQAAAVDAPPGHAVRPVARTGTGDNPFAEPPPGGVVFGDPRPRRPMVWTGIGVGLVLLAAQVLWFEFDDWGRQPQWRTVYEPLCEVLGCSLPLQRDLDLLTTRNLAVRTAPGGQGRLLVNAVIANEASFSQPFPELELRFTTVHGNLVAGHRLRPEDYLAGDAAGMTLIPPRTPVQIEIVIDDPGPDAVNYFLRLR